MSGAEKPETVSFEEFAKEIDRRILEAEKELEKAMIDAAFRTFKETKHPSFIPLTLASLIIQHVATLCDFYDRTFTKLRGTARDE